jgi:hypothetical protein
MKVNVRVALASAFFVVFFAVGVPYWRIPYSQASLPNSLYGWGLVVILVLAAVLRFKASFVRTFITVGLAVPAMVLARVVAETSRDPTSHNLWPFEIIIAAGVGFSAALAGALLGGLLVLALKKGLANADGT